MEQSSLQVSTQSVSRHGFFNARDQFTLGSAGQVLDENLPAKNEDRVRARKFALHVRDNSLLWRQSLSSSNHEITLSDYWATLSKSEREAWHHDYENQRKITPWSALLEDQKKYITRFLNMDEGRVFKSLVSDFESFASDIISAKWRCLSPGDQAFVLYCCEENQFINRIYKNKFGDLDRDFKFYLMKKTDFLCERYVNQRGVKLSCNAFWLNCPNQERIELLQDYFRETKILPSTSACFFIAPAKSKPWSHLCQEFKKYFSENYNKKSESQGAISNKDRSDLAETCWLSLNRINQRAIERFFKEYQEYQDSLFPQTTSTLG